MLLISILTVNSSTIKATLMALSNFLDGLIFILPGESWSMIISEFIRIVEVMMSTLPCLHSNPRWIKSPARQLQKHSICNVRFCGTLLIVACRERIWESCRMSWREVSNSYLSTSIDRYDQVVCWILFRGLKKTFHTFPRKKIQCHTLLRTYKSYFNGSG